MKTPTKKTAKKRAPAKKKAPAKKRVSKKLVPTQEANTLFPGRPNYVGPRRGFFGMLHHGRLVEFSYNVMERVVYVNRNKPPNEVSIRLHNMIYIGPAEGERGTRPSDKEALAYIKKHIPDHAWNARKQEMKFPE